MHGHKNSLRAFVMVLFLCSVAYAQGQQPSLSAEDEMYRPTVMPDRIVLTWAGDPATSQAVTWRTDTSVKSAIAQIVDADAGPKFEGRAHIVPAITSELVTGYWAENCHSVNFKDLKPDTQYVYRVGDGSHWSEWVQFRTASDKPTAFTFIYFGDVQTGIKPLWSRVLREAYKTAPNAGFMVFAGDLVDSGIDDVMWGKYFGAGGWLYGMMNVLPVPGNHEKDQKDEVGNMTLTKHWRAQFTLPENGPKGLEEYAFFTDYQGVRFISIYSSESITEQAEWLDKVLADNPNRWTIMAMHHPVYSLSKGRNDNVARRTALETLLNKYQVDLVLSGHDHTYARSGMEKSTVYVSSVSGSKMYELERKPWMKRMAEDTQLFQVISIDGDKLSYQSRTATGSLYDAFEIVKSGKEKQFVDKVPADVPERARVKSGTK